MSNVEKKIFVAFKILLTFFSLEIKYSYDTSVKNIYIRIYVTFHVCDISAFKCQIYFLKT